MSGSGADAVPSVLIVGVGRFGALHARVWSEAGAHVTGLCDLDARRLEEVAARHGHPDTDTNLERLLARVRPNAVVVASDEARHVEHAAQALRAGAHVFIEKPLALSAADALRLHTRASAAGREIVAGQISRFATPYLRLQQRIRDGVVGALCALRLRRDFSRAWFSSFGDRVHPVWESCIHDIDLAVGFVGRPAVRATAVSSASAGQAASSVVAALLEFEGGVIATIESAWLLPDATPRNLAGTLELDGTIAAEAEVLGQRGVIHQRLLGGDLVEWTDDATYVPDLSLWPEENGEVGGALRREVDYALAVFAGTRPNNVIPLQQACWGVAAAEAIIASLRTRQPVDVAAGPVEPLTSRTP